MTPRRLSWKRLIRMRDRILVDAEFTATIAARTILLKRARAITAEIREVGRCQRCGRKLENADSVAKGIGPECEDILGVEAGRRWLARLDEDIADSETAERRVADEASKAVR